MLFFILSNPGQNDGESLCELVALLKVDVLIRCVRVVGQSVNSGQ
jgi:hypothetical protein